MCWRATGSENTALKRWKEGEEKREPESQKYLGEFSKGKIRKEVQLLGYLEFSTETGEESLLAVLLSVLQCITHLPYFKRPLHLLAEEINRFHADL